MKPLGPRDYGFIGLLAAISLINPLSIHFYLPALPAIKAAFQVTAATAQLTFSVTMFTLAAVTLAIGSLSDGLGRKPVLVGGIVLFVGGSLICAVAGGIEALILGRLLQAAGAASGLVLARAIARDVYGLERLTQIIAILTMAYVMGPMISPPLGGAVVDGLGWRWIFWLAASAGGLLVVFSVLLIPETRPAGARIQGARAMLGAYRRLFRIPRFSLYVLHTGFVTGAFFAIAAASSFLMTGMLGRPAAEYGLYFLFFPAGYLLGNFIAARIGLRVPIDTMVMAGSVLNLAGAAGAGRGAVAGDTDAARHFPARFRRHAEPGARAAERAVRRDCRRQGPRRHRVRHRRVHADVLRRSRVAGDRAARRRYPDAHDPRRPSALPRRGRGQPRARQVERGGALARMSGGHRTALD